MRSFSPFEAAMARIVSGLLGDATVEDIVPLLVREHRKPPCLSGSFVEWLQSALAKGCTQRLAREGWREEVVHTAAGRKHGRLWERYQPESMPLHFSRNSVLMLQWLTAANAAQSKASGRIRTESTTAGDHVLNLLIFDRLQFARLVQMNLAGKPVIKSNPLVSLLFPDAAIVEFGEPIIDFEPWFQSDRVWVIEALQWWLTSRWVQCELDNRRTGSAADLRRRGRTQTMVLSAFLDAADSADRRDLALFALRAAGRVLRSGGHTSSPWFELLNLQGFRMSERSEIYRAGLALFRSLSRLQQWNQEARAASFYDENYESSQAWMSRWENLAGDDVVGKANQVIRQQDPAATIG